MEHIAMHKPSKIQPSLLPKVSDRLCCGDMDSIVFRSYQYIAMCGNTRMEYDSWNRMQKITYPDGEVVGYTYDLGGNLLSMTGTKNNSTTNYIKKIHYNEQEKRSYIEYGNGVKTRYNYDSRMRLDSLICTDNSNNVLQKIKYTYDSVDNITRVVNSGGTVNTLGGSYVYTHTYDVLNRLIASSGTYKNANSYSLTMGYTGAGKLTKKINSKLSQNLVYAYCSNEKPHAPRRILNNTDGYITDLRWDATGNLGHVNYYDNNGVWQQTRHIGWTEDNRITNVIDKSYHSYYSYDDGGERVLKLTGPSNIIDVNAEFLTYQSDLKNITLYTSPYLVAHNKGYTKHFYAGSERVCAAIGEGGLNSLEPCIGQNGSLQTTSTNLFNNTMGTMHDRYLLDNTYCLNNGEDVDKGLKIELEEVVTRVVINPSVDGSTFHSTLNKYCSQNKANSAVYYYHSDHLGSASWITNKTGAPVQHLQYMPYGEPLVNERTGSYEERFTFTGKERDSETGLSYFGARYYDSDLMTGWLSVDPMADKYPNISPYAYCAWNPIRLVDPDGRKIRGVRYNHKRGKYVYSIGAILRGTNKYINARIKTESGQVGINNLMNSPEKYTIRVTDKPIFLQNEKEKLNQISGIVLNDTYILISTADKIKDDTYSLLILSDKSIESIYAKMEDIEQNIESNYSEVANDVGIIEFEKKHPYQTKEERIHGIGAHEEVHAMGNQDEKSAFLNEMKERLEYIEKNYNE